MYVISLIIFRCTCWYFQSSFHYEYGLIFKLSKRQMINKFVTPRHILLPPPLLILEL